LSGEVLGKRDVNYFLRPIKITKQNYIIFVATDIQHLLRGMIGLGVLDVGHVGLSVVVARHTTIGRVALLVSLTVIFGWTKSTKKVLRTEMAINA